MVNTGWENHVQVTFSDEIDRKFLLDSCWFSTKEISCPAALLIHPANLPEQMSKLNSEFRKHTVENRFGVIARVLLKAASDSRIECVRAGS